MYQFVDRPVERLGNGSRFILWAMRAWTNAARRARCPRATIGGAFVNMDAAPALADFHAAMARLWRGGAPIIGFAPLACRQIADGEAVLLALWQDVAAGERDRALGVLRLVTPAATVDLLHGSLVAAVDHLRHAGLAPTGLTAVPTSNIGGIE